jgi:teichoic acid transport system ATP-binding protein
MSDKLLVAKELNVIYSAYEDNLNGIKQRFSSRSFSRRQRLIHAVRDVNLNLSAGDSLGVIGSNGSGKSTLLAALCGLIPPASGSVMATSRPRLLGVHAALRPHLSGRLNLMIGGLALGMRRAEIEGRIDELIEFAGLLAFTVATATNPEILVIDEALAVGDAEFKARSEQTITLLREAAGAVILVSHNLQEIERSCSRAIWLDAGVIQAQGPVAEVITAYTSGVRTHIDPMAAG